MCKQQRKQQLHNHTQQQSDNNNKCTSCIESQQSCHKSQKKNGDKSLPALILQFSTFHSLIQFM